MAPRRRRLRALRLLPELRRRVCHVWLRVRRRCRPRGVLLRGPIRPALLRPGDSTRRRALLPPARRPARGRAVPRRWTAPARLAGRADDLQVPSRHSRRPVRRLLPRPLRGLLRPLDRAGPPGAATCVRRARGGPRARGRRRERHSRRRSWRPGKREVPRLRNAMDVAEPSATAPRHELARIRRLAQLHLAPPGVDPIHVTVIADPHRVRDRTRPHLAG